MSTHTQQTLDRPPAPVPEKPNFTNMRSAVQECRACDLWEGATQAVMGEGKRGATVMLVGEQPGDREDIEGHPFVGPAGGVLDKGLQRAGIDERDAAMDQFVADLSNVATWLSER